MQLTKDDPERAHEIAVAFLESGLTPKDLGVDDERLAFEVRLYSFFLLEHTVNVTPL
jgi:hypothetical protein